MMTSKNNSDRAYPYVKKHGRLKSRPRIVSPRTIVIHHTGGGTITGAEDTLKRRGLGYHYMIDGDGTVVEYVPPSRRCAHAYRNNTGTIGIAYVGGGDFGACNEGQYISLIELCRDIKKEYPTVKNVTGHKHIDPRGWKIDPRWSGEPPNGVDWDIDMKWMLHIRDKTGLHVIWHPSRRNKDGTAKY
jgi:N-acetyl-anhydromuramyl-L-alanine amidase AmpD